MKPLTGTGIGLLAALLVALYVGHRAYESGSDAAQLRATTLEDAIQTVAVVHPTPLPPTETITLPGNVVGCVVAPMYARVTGYVKMWYRDYGDRQKARSSPKSTRRISMPNMPKRERTWSRSARYKLAEVTAKRVGNAAPQSRRPSSRSRCKNRT
ncbi:MAG: hypothetical protein U0231_13915 [Nitrospiraceae bacterium]